MCESCKRELNSIIILAKKMANFDNTVYFIYSETNIKGYKITDIEPKDYTLKIKPFSIMETSKNRIEYIVYKGITYRKDKFTYEFFKAIKQDATIEQYEKLTGLKVNIEKNGDDIQDDSEEVKQKSVKRNKRKDI